MSRSDVLRRLTTILVDVAKVDPTLVSVEKTFAGDLEVDSLSLVEVIVVAEADFGIRVTDEQMESFATVGDIVSHVEHALAARSDAGWSTAEGYGACARPAPSR